MTKFSQLCWFFCFTFGTSGAVYAQTKGAQGQAHQGGAPAQVQIANAPIHMRVLAQTPADSDTDLQVICLFKSDPASPPLRAALAGINAKLNGLLDRIRKPGLFRGDLGETLLITPPRGTISAKKLLIVGVGDLETFTPERMELVGSIVFREANRLGVADPFFSPTLVDGGMTKYTPGQVSDQVTLGFLRAVATEKVLGDAGNSPGMAVKNFTFLTVEKFIPVIEAGMEKAVSAGAGQ